jgi:WW domain-binding protein 2
VPGVLYLTTARLVFIASTADPSGLVAFALPLAALSADTDFKQPLFSPNNLAGKVSATGGETHSFKLEFREGGTGTFLPLYFNLLELNRVLAARGGGGGGGSADAGAAPAAGPPPPAPAPAAPPKPDVATAFVDPSDPTKLFLTEPETKKQ